MLMTMPTSSLIANWWLLLAEDQALTDGNWERKMSATAHDGLAVVKPGQTYVGKQGFTYGAGASAETVEGLHERTADAARRGRQGALSRGYFGHSVPLIILYHPVKNSANDGPCGSVPPRSTGKETAIPLRRCSVFRDIHAAGWQQMGR
jgi:hypothetical protein